MAQTAVEHQTPDRDKVAIGTKLGYAIGGAAEGASTWAFTGFNFIIYTVGFGLPGTLAGAAVFLSIILDAVSDPLIGYLSDRWQSRFGRRHPFLYLSSVPLGLTIFCIYCPPDALLQSSGDVWTLFGASASSEQWALAAWLFVFASLFKFFHTCYHLPHLALGSELTPDYLERTRVFRYNMIFSFSGGAALSISFHRVFFPEGPLLGMDTLVFATSVAVFTAVIIFLTAYLTHDQIPRLQQPPKDQVAPSVPEFYRQAIGLFRNRNYLMLFLGLLFLSMMTGVRETLNVNMGLFYWELTPAQLSLIPLFTIGSYFIALVVVAHANRVIEKGGTARMAVLAAFLAASLPVVLRSLDVLPDNGHPLIFYMIGASAFFYYGSLGVLTVSVYSAIGDVVDENELVTGRRQEGMFYAVRTFFGKLANGFGHLFGGIAIDVIGFPPGAVVGEVGADIIFNLGLFEGVIATSPALLAVYFYGKYRIDKRRHKEILDELATRRNNADITELAART